MPGSSVRGVRLLRFACSLDSLSHPVNLSFPQSPSQSASQLCLVRLILQSIVGSQ